ncbi:putative mutator protein MutT4 [Anaerotignum neopropionicum]|uniref:Putative mutator protein MutT4 n=1 Tax=Anaerotignum neopropionicum TaxID=36847 RepID=A0A136WDP1_9FIRM|nr:CoA pyrophosphatase [Anaerotignum neopropionicum]KXL52637.1 putative mutator protein MutT4 [Anaerotignum neopropionicum]
MSENKLDIQAISHIFKDHKAEPIFKLRRFAVLALITEKNGELCFVLNKRAMGVRQPGDICFPGGHHECGEKLEQTALRETEEELGIHQSEISILGKSDYMLTIYGGVIQPFLGYVCYDVLRCSCPNPEEVAQIFTVPVSYFMETPPEIHDMVWKAAGPDTFPYHRIEGGKDYPFAKSRIPELFYEYKGHTIWGFTAQVIQNIVDLLKQE